jgi:hypothetical protein
MTGIGYAVPCRQRVAVIFRLHRPPSGGERGSALKEEGYLAYSPDSRQCPAYLEKGYMKLGRPLLFLDI